MNSLRAGVPLTVIASVFLGIPPSHARDLTFLERVKAQEAIERIYYSHQVGATRPFEEAVPRGVLERKVRTYLKQSLALERIWSTPVSAQSLTRELDRISQSTRFPDRLKEIFAALDNDLFLIQECFARPVLVDRLTGCGRMMVQGRLHLFRMDSGAHDRPVFPTS